jgi:intracellular sulfur oxidation DsrE/DsrF family protein
MRYNAVFHVNKENIDSLLTAVNNITNLYKAVNPAECSVCILANGPAVKLFQKENTMTYAADLDKVKQSGVRFLLCRNSLQNFKIKEDSLVMDCEVIPAAIVELIRLQQNGYAYVKP